VAVKTENKDLEPKLQLLSTSKTDAGETQLTVVADKIQTANKSVPVIKKLDSSRLSCLEQALSKVKPPIRNINLDEKRGDGTTIDQQLSVMTSENHDTFSAHVSNNSSILSDIKSHKEPLIRGTLEKDIFNLREDCVAIKPAEINDDSDQKLMLLNKSINAVGEAQLKEVADQIKLQKFSQLESYFLELENQHDSLQKETIDDLTAQNLSLLERIKHLELENDEMKNKLCLLEKKQSSILSAGEQRVVLDEMKRENEKKGNPLNEIIAALNSLNPSDELNQSHLKKSVHKLVQLFGDQIPTSTFHLKLNRKKHWTSEKAKSVKFINAFEKQLKKGRLDDVITAKLGESLEGVSVSWKDALQQLVDAARSDLISEAGMV
jgi:hypothetical protein